MKNRIILICLVLFAASVKNSSAQFEVGDNIIGAGIGFGSSLLGSGAYSNSTPGLSVQYERGNWDVGGPGVISLGGYLGYKSYTYDNIYYDARWTYVILGLRSAYHYTGFDNKQWDPYGGLMLSYSFADYSYESNITGFQYGGDTYGNHMSLSLYLGSRYYFSSQWSAFAELGYGISFLSLGAAYKIP